MKTRGDAESAISRVLSQARASLKDPSRPVTPAARSLFFAADAEHSASAGGESFGFAPGRERSSWAPKQRARANDGTEKVRDRKGKRSAFGADRRGEREELNATEDDQQSLHALKTASALGLEWGGANDLEQSTESLDEEMVAVLASRYPSPPQVGRSGDSPGQSSTGGRSCRLNLEHEPRSEGPEGKYDDGERAHEDTEHQSADVEPAVGEALSLYSVQVEAMDIMQELLPKLSLSRNGDTATASASASAGQDTPDLSGTCDKVRLLISALYGKPDLRQGDGNSAIRESEFVAISNMENCFSLFSRPL